MNNETKRIANIKSIVIAKKTKISGDLFKDIKEKVSEIRYIAKNKYAKDKLKNIESGVNQILEAYNLDKSYKFNIRIHEIEPVDHGKPKCPFIANPYLNKPEPDISVVAKIYYIGNNKNIDRDKFFMTVGREPQLDDLERCNCKQTGITHSLCGWCDVHNKPRFICGCENKQCYK